MGHKVSKVQLMAVVIVTVFLSAIVLSDYACDHPITSHIDSCKSKLIGLTEKKTPKQLPLSTIVFLFTPPQIDFQILSQVDGNTYRSTFTPSDHLKSRAPPVFA